MNNGPNQPSPGGQGGRRNRRRRMRRGAPNQNQNQNRGQQMQGGGSGGRGRPRRGRQQQAFTGPMDHSYRNGPPGNGQMRPQGRSPQVQRFYQQPDVEPLSTTEGPHPRIFAFVDDLFFTAKIQETARKLNITVDFVKSEQEVFDKLAEQAPENGAAEQNGNGNPALVIFDLNSVASKPLQTIHKLRQRFKRDTNIIGFLSHLQSDLKLKAQEAGCDMVLPRSAFSQNLPQLLRRHATSADEEIA
jgi:CheY-like chemotaxis protein